MTLQTGRDAQGRFTPGQQNGIPFTPGHELADGSGRPPGSPNKPYNPHKELFFERHIETVIANKFRDLVDGLVGDLGGWDELGVGQLQLVRRCAMLCTQCEIWEQKAAEGGPFDPLLYSMLTNTLTRALKALGLGMKDIEAHRGQVITVVDALPDLPLADTDSASPTYRPSPEGARPGANAPPPPKPQAEVLRMPDRGVV
jgi:hypothetical protein